MEFNEPKQLRYEAWLNNVKSLCSKYKITIGQLLHILYDINLLKDLWTWFDAEDFIHKGLSEEE